MKVKDFAPGATFTLMDERFVLLKRNDCRALVQPTRRQHHEFTDTRTGTLISFEAPARAINISPNTEVTP